jgi:MFS family permease
MSPIDDDPPTSAPATSVAPPLPGAVPAGGPPISGPAEPDLPEVGGRYIWLIVLAQAGAFVAFITPIAISLSIRLDELAPGQEQYLGYIIGAGAFAVVLTGPFFGVLSDRTRTRLGRRRPFIIGGTVLGMGALTVMAQAPSVLVLGIGWVLTQLTWGQAFGNLQFSTADRLPESQRGKVAGLLGFGTQVAPVLGVALAGGFSGNDLLLFLVPGAVGAVLVLLFVVFVHEDDSRGMELGPRLAIGSLLGKFVFDPRRYPDFSWNWLGRFLFYFGLSLNTTFTAFFFASRLGITVGEVAGTIAFVALGGILATTLGAIGGGFLSDRLRRRRVFVLASGAIFAVGAVVMAFAADLPMLVVGSLLSSVGIGGFSAVEQALTLDVLPERATDAGRFMAIFGFATSIPQAVAPLIAPAVLAIGATGQNYQLLYVLAGVFTLLGGVVVLRIRSVR